MRILLSLLLFSALNWSIGQTCENRKYDSGLEVIYEGIATYVPSGWNLDILNEHNFEGSDCATMSSQISSEYVKYPASLRAALKLKLVWFSRFKYKNVDFWCTYNTRLKTVYLKSYTQNHFYTKQMFHHELSSVLLKEYGQKDFETKFKSLLPEDFIYFDEAGGGRNAIDQNQDSEAFEASLNEKGFLNQYSMSFWENDFNEIAQNLFLPKVEFWSLYDQYPRIKAKTDLIISFYEDINPNLNNSFFRAFAK